ncbi:MAG: ATP-grasp domain-containing protein [Nanoarchaeota archaeon]|nr:ATP-grasp domain-containing protein [Nanoarchaeota archaeon]
MVKTTIGYIFHGLKLSDEDKDFIRLAKKKNINFLLFNLSEEISEKEIEKKAKKCDLIFNNTAGYLALELLKTFEELGVKTIDKSKVFYYTEDKWMFYLKCKEHNIPTPDTILLPVNLNAAKADLEKFNNWPVILKRVNGEQGEFVEKADNKKQAVELIKKFWENGKEKLPIIAQEFVKSPSYRLTIVDGKIVQTALKDGHGWKATAVYAEKVGKFQPDSKLIDLAKRITKISGIKICGLDFLKKGDNWLVVDINAEPSFEFFEDEMEKLIGIVLDFLKKYAKPTYAGS